MKSKIHNVRHRIRMDRLQAAFDAASAALYDQIKDLERRAQELTAQNPTGSNSARDFDPEDDPVGDIHDEIIGIQYSLAHLRKAFAILIYHTWERGALKWFTYSKAKPNHQDFIDELTKHSCSFDGNALRDLKDLVNCIKHNSTSSGPALYSNRPGWFIEGFSPQAVVSPD